MTTHRRYWLHQKTQRNHFFLMEDTFQIASIHKKGLREYDIDWYSGYAKSRFETYCNCLSISETLEAIEPGALE